MLNEPQPTTDQVGQTAHQPQININVNVNFATNTGSGAIAQGSNVTAAGERSVTIQGNAQGSSIITGNNGLLSQSSLLITSISQMFTPLIENRTKLFGGRDTILAAIKQSIQSQPAAYLVITAPAGFGKTALMAKMITDPPYAIAYHFFSPLYGEDSLSERTFLENVIQQMTTWHGENQQLPEQHNVLRALYHQFIDKPLSKPHILILDGLDEISQWHIGPYLSRQLPNNLYIILTVRDVGQDWMIEYQLPTDQTVSIPLEGLNRDEVAQVFCAAGGDAIAFATDPKLLDQVMMISAYQTNPQLGADPFYIRLLAEDALEGHLTVQNLVHQPHGLENYLKVWWQQIKTIAGEQPIKDLFGTLTVVLKPISRIDLEAINPSLVDNWTTDYFDDVLRKARRWVFGNNVNGYMVAHPRLRFYMQNQIRTDVYVNQLLTYCEAWPSHHSAYVMQNYSYHLYQVGQREKLCALIETEAWYDAKSIATPWADSLVDDLNLASELDKTSTIDDWIRATGYQIRRARVENDLGRMSPSTIFFLAKVGQVRRAMAAAKRHDDYRQPYLINEIAKIAVTYDSNTALTILLQLARSADDESSGARCVRRQEAARIILQLLPQYHQDARTLLHEAEAQSNLIPRLEREGYMAYWVFPNYALVDGLEIALSQAQALQPLEHAKALRWIASVLPSGHVRKREIAEQCLNILASLEETPTVVCDKLCATVDLLLVVDPEKQRLLLEHIETLGNHPLLVQSGRTRATVQTYALQKIALIAPAWTKQMLIQEDWSDDLSVVSELAKADYSMALALLNDRFANYWGRSQVLVDIIGVVASKDPVQANQLIDLYKEKLRDDLPDAYVALAEGYLHHNKDRALAIFNKHVLVEQDDYTIYTQNQLQLALIRAVSEFVPVGIVAERLLHFQPCPHGHEDERSKAELILAEVAIEQRNLTFLDNLSYTTQHKVVLMLAESINPTTAEEFMTKHGISVTNDEQHEFDAIQVSVAALDDPAKLANLLSHFDDNGQTHHFCAHMRILPSTLWKLIQAEKIEPDKITNVIQQVLSKIIPYNCPAKAKKRGMSLLQNNCHCVGDKELLIPELVGLLFYLDELRAEEVWATLPNEPTKVYALKRGVELLGATEERVQRLIQVSNQCIQDPASLALFCYDVARGLKSDMALAIAQLIQQADSIAPPQSSHIRQVCRAQAKLRQVRSYDDLSSSLESFEIMKTFTQLQDKVATLEPLIQEAKKWSPAEQRQLLFKLLNIIKDFKVTDVYAFIVSLIPLLHELGNEEALWNLVKRIEWSHQT